MFDLEANKAVALRLIDIFNRRRLDLLEDVLHPEFRGRGISAFPPDGPEVGPVARRKLYEMFLQAIPDARGDVLDVVAERRQGRTGRSLRWHASRRVPRTSRHGRSHRVDGNPHLHHS